MMMPNKRLGMSRTALWVICCAAGVWLARAEEPSPKESEGPEGQIRTLRALEADLTGQLEEVQAEIARLEQEIEEARLLESSVVVATTRTRQKVKMYERPTPISGTIRWIPDGERLDLLDVAGNAFTMVQVTLEGDVGWVMADLLDQEDLKPLLEEQTEERAAEDRKAKLKREAARRARGSEPFLITGLRVEGPDSAEGVGAVVRLMMLDEERMLKYLTLTYTPYNGVGDRVASEHPGRISSTTRKITGPMSFQDGDGSWGGDPIWYNPSIRCVEIDRIDVEYMNGERYTYVGELPKVLDPSIRNDCSYQAQHP